MRQPAFPWRDATPIGADPHFWDMNVTTVSVSHPTQSERLEDMVTKRDSRRGHGGFTLIELLIVVAIIGIIAAILIPNLLDGLQKAKQKRVMTDMHLIGTAWMSWLSDMASGAAAGRSSTVIYEWDTLYTNKTYEEMSADLVPQYASRLPEVDPWGSEYEFGAGEDPVESPRPFAVRSPGSDAVFDDSYSAGPFIATDYSQDIVWAGGLFVRWPAGLSAPSGDS